MERARLDRAQGVSVRGSRGEASRESEALGVRPGGSYNPTSGLWTHGRAKPPEGQRPR